MEEGEHLIRFPVRADDNEGDCATALVEDADPEVALRVIRKAQAVFGAAIDRAECETQYNSGLDVHSADGEWRVVGLDRPTETPHLRVVRD